MVNYFEGELMRGELKLGVRVAVWTRKVNFELPVGLVKFALRLWRLSCTASRSMWLHRILLCSKQLRRGLWMLFWWCRHKKIVDGRSIEGDAEEHVSLLYAAALVGVSRVGHGCGILEL